MGLPRVAVAATLALVGCVETRDFTPLGEIELRIPAEPLVAREGSISRVAIEVARGSGQNGAILVRAMAPPAGIQIPDVVVAAGETVGELELSLIAPALGSEIPIKIIGEGEGGKIAESEIKVLPIGKIGSIDRSFGVAGRVSLAAAVDSDRECRAWSVEGNETLVNTSPATSISFTRLRFDGSINRSFGVNGVASIATLFTTMSRQLPTELNVAIQTDGKIVVAATADDALTTTRPDALALLRLLPNGSADTSFGNNGMTGLFDARRAKGVAITAANDILVWHRGVGNDILTRFGPNGSSPVSSAPTTNVTSATSDMLVQPDGKSVFVVNDSGGYSLLRMGNDLALDMNFGRSGILRLAGTPLRWITRKDGGFTGVGARFDYPVSGASSAHIVRFDGSWRANDGFADGGVSLTNVSTLLSGVIESFDGGTLVAGWIEGQVQVIHLMGASVDMSIGVNGIVPVSTLPTRTGGYFLTPSGPYRAILSYAIHDQSCELIRIWR